MTPHPTPTSRTVRTALGLALAAFGAAAAASAGTYALDAAHTSVGFGVKHMMVSTVHGQFERVSGSAEVDESDLEGSSVRVVIEAASIDTRNQNRDDHLRSADFFDVESHPEIVFQSTSMERTGDTEFLVTGDLTIRGTTREVTFPATIVGPVDDPRGGKRIGVEAELTIDRQDFGVAYSRVLEGGGLVVGDEVDITLGAELTGPVDGGGE